MAKQFERIVFMQGDDAEEPLRILDESGEDAAIEYLAQWDMEPGEMMDEPAHGTSDYTYTSADGFLLTYNTHLGYIGLERIHGEEDEPQEEDYQTSDYLAWYQSGKRVLTLEENESWPEAIKAHMDANGFFPNCWYIGERGEANLLDLATGTFVGDK